MCLTCPKKRVYEAVDCKTRCNGNVERMPECVDGRDDLRGLYFSFEIQMVEHKSLVGTPPCCDQNGRGNPPSGKNIGGVVGYHPLTWLSFRDPADRSRKTGSGREPEQENAYKTAMGPS
jgi:hypothetical protein